jgi:predicted phosphodiesterase
MALAIVSDIHGNLTAFEAVIEDIARRGITHVVHGGDLALMGARPAEVLDRVAELGWTGVVGNTDELLWRPQEHNRQLEKAPRLEALLNLLFDAYAPATIEMIGSQRLAALRGLPAERRVGDLVVVHAGPNDLWRAPMPDDAPADVMERYAPLRARRVVYGHIHRPYVRHLEGFTLANAGSVGLPWDGDPRASYLVIDDDIQIVRVVYDVEAEVRALTASRYPDAKRIAKMLRSGKFVRP